MDTQTMKPSRPSVKEVSAALSSMPEDERIELIRTALKGRFQIVRADGPTALSFRVEPLRPCHRR